ALFIAAIPVVKMLMRGTAPQPLRFVGQMFDGAAKPVGGDAEGTIRIEDNGSDRPQPAAPAPQTTDTETACRYVAGVDVGSHRFRAASRGPRVGGRTRTPAQPAAGGYPPPSGR